MPNKKVYDAIPEKYKNNFKSPYYRFDTLATSSDLSALFEVLHSVKDKNGSPAVLTANTIMTNPDFEKIREDRFKKYHYELFTTTLTRYYGKEVFELWKQGMTNGCFQPQLHGREHVRVSKWMEMLQKGHPLIFDAFQWGMNSADHDLKASKKNFNASLDYSSEAELSAILEASEEATVMFKELFGFSSKSFIAPSYTWSQHVEKTLSKNGVNYLQGMRVQKIPTGVPCIYQSEIRYSGMCNGFGQYYLVRNVFFEPTLLGKKNLLKNCLRRIKWLFFLNKPVIISSHRLNFIGTIFPENRDKNLTLFKELLTQITTIWPDVEFMSSDQLGHLITLKKYHD